MPIRKRITDPVITLTDLANMPIEEVRLKRHKIAPLALLPDEEADQIAGDFNDIFDEHYDGSLAGSDKVTGLTYAELEQMSKLVESLRDLVYAAYYANT